MNMTVNPAVSYGKKTRLSDKEFDDTIRLAVATYGKETQTQMLFEEMSELQNAICKLARGRDSADHVCEEIADVIIMCLQMAHIYGEKSVEKWANIKMLRLYNHLAKELGCVPAPASAGEVYNGEDALLRPLQRKEVINENN